MIKFKTIKFLILLLILTNSVIASGSDSAKEKRWAEQISDSIMTGEIQWLSANNQKFMSIFTPAQTEKLLGGVILAHGIGVHPNWSDVIQPLRTELPEHSWATLSLQMPILTSDVSLIQYLPLFDEATARFEAAIEFLNSKNINNIVIVAHSFGSAMSVYYLSQKRENTKNAGNSVQAFVAIGMSSQDSDDKLNVVKSLTQLKLPILDLFGSRDLDLVIESAPARAKAARKAGNSNYTQIEVIGADHFFARMDGILLSKVKSWLAKNASGVAVLKNSIKTDIEKN